MGLKRFFKKVAKGGMPKEQLRRNVNVQRLVTTAGTTGLRAPFKKSARESIQRPFHRGGMYQRAMRPKYMDPGVKSVAEAVAPTVASFFGGPAAGAAVSGAITYAQVVGMKERARAMMSSFQAPALEGVISTDTPMVARTLPYVWHISQLRGRV